MLALAACGGGGTESGTGTGQGSFNTTPSLVYTTITSSLPSVPADGHSAAVITVQLYTGLDQKVTKGGFAVTMAIVQGGGNLSGVQDNGDGSYTANLTSWVVGGDTIQLSLSGGPGNSVTVGTSVPPTPTAFYEPVVSTAGCSTANELWLVNAADPTAAPVQVTTAAFDLMYGCQGAIYYNWAFDTQGPQLLDRYPAYMVYPSGGHFYGVSLTNPGTPQQISNATYTQVCDYSPLQAGPYGESASFIFAHVLTSASAAGASCSMPSTETTWIIPTSESAASAPKVGPAGLTWAGGLVDGESGLLDGMLMQNGTELDVYDAASMTKTTALLTGLPSGATIYPLSANGGPLTPTQPVVVQYSQGSDTIDDIYMVGITEATKITSYSTPATAPALSNASGGCSDLAPPSLKLTGETVNDFAFLYSVPGASGGFTIYILNGTGTPQAVYADASHCFQYMDGESEGYLVFNISAPNVAQYSEGAISDVAIVATGPSTQTAVTVSTNSGSPTNPTFNSVVYVTDGIAWVDSETWNSGTATAASVNLVNLSNGSVAQSYSDSQIGGAVWAGVDGSGDLFPQEILLAQGSLPVSGSACYQDSPLQWSGVAIVDPSSLDSTSVTTDGQECQQDVYQLMYGPSPFVMGNLTEASGPLTTTFSLITSAGGATAAFNILSITANSSSSLQPLESTFAY